LTFPPRRTYHIPLPRGRVLELGSRPVIMGILNITPDSFAETAHLLDAEAAVDAALRMEAEGADLIDVGGESTRPGADALSAAEELARVLPVIGALAGGRLTVPLSIDTYKADVARAAIDAGAAMINDISGLRYDPALAGVAAVSGAALLLMHTRGRSKAMYSEARYENVVAEVAAELQESVQTATAAGVRIDRILVDPGLGFAKQAIHSYRVLARLAEVTAALDRPLVVGPSRKSFMREALDGRSAPERDWGTAAAVTTAVLAGAHIVRVHAVSQMRQVVRVAEEIRRAYSSDGEPL
jgi:dihydropteroate synthase